MVGCSSHTPSVIDEADKSVKYSTSVSEVMHALHHMVTQGKVLYLGISDTPAWYVSLRLTPDTHQCSRTELTLEQDCLKGK